MANIYPHTKFGANRSINDRDIAVLCFQDGGRPPSWILGKDGILGHSDPCMANIYPHTKFGANRSINGRDIAIYVFSIWRPSAILDLL